MCGCVHACIRSHHCGKPKEGDISYQLLLGTSASSVDSDAFSTYASQKGSTDSQEVTLNFYTGDGKQQKAGSHTWTLAEQLTSLGIERSLEDHEDILQVYASWSNQKESDAENKFIFKQDFCKYEFFRTPQQFFPLSMLDLGSIPLDCLSESPDLAKFVTLQNILSNGEKSPVVQSLLWCREPGKDSWKRLFFRIEGTDFMRIFCILSQQGCKTTVLAFSRSHGYGRKIRENYKEVQSRHMDSLWDLQIIELPTL
ncbi:growth factor receptor-bound protein 14 [Caerostris extrusa]|uniref:Growth factor receptor-bound protein 14 n=1 Tax=Caerostris extrusa TaxID=172846 RepID=A0AAV4TP63_CAEEX|nr:growth factor receptor-bound protein 14 [Caerostris extrusa]